MRFKTLVGEPVRSKFMALPPFTEQAQRFAAVGIHEPRQLLARTATPYLTLEYLRGGNFDFTPFVYHGLSKTSLSWRIPDHYPLWVEFSL
jgi:hypothetical protein